MTDLATAAAEGLRDVGPYVLVTGRPTPAIAPLVAAAQRHVVAAGPTTRLAVAAGIAVGGHRAVTVVDAACDFTARAGGIALTESSEAARRALRSGWSVVQAWSGDDLAGLLDAAPRPTVVVLAPDAALDGAPAPDQRPAARGVRVWRDGELGTVAASGAAVAALLRIGERLHSRGVPVTLVEVATLTAPGLHPLIGGDALYVGGPDAHAALGRADWPEPMARVSLEGVEDADLVGSVLSHIPAA